MTSLANLHLRSARGDAPTDEEWRAVRNVAGNLVRSAKSANREGFEHLPRVLACFEMLAWPSHELDNALPVAVLSSLQGEASSGALRKAYTPEQWVERNAPKKA